MTTIAKVTAHAVAYPEPNDSNATRYLVFARVESADGAVGWGEAVTQFPASTKATVVILETIGASIVGRDVRDNVQIWRDLRSQGWWYGYRGGIFCFALSAIDIALWDLKGRCAGLSVSQLIGSNGRAVPNGIPVLASTHAFRADLDAEVSRHAEYVRAGYLGVKIGMGKRGDARLGYDVERDVGFVRDLRAACDDGAWLMMDRGQSLNWTWDETSARVRGWEEHGLKWVEEPFEPWEVENFRRLRAQSTCMIAGGEREWDLRGYAEVIASGTLDVIGCDVGRAEGITGALNIIRLVESAGLWFNSHAWSSAVNTAASIALSASTDRCLLQEMKPEPSPMQHELVRTPIEASGGFVQVPTGHGLGVDVDEAVLRAYAF